MQESKRKIATVFKVSLETHNALHYLKEPFETTDDALFRILSKYDEMQKKVKMLEEMLVEKQHA